MAKYWTKNMDIESRYLGLHQSEAGNSVTRLGDFYLVTLAGNHNGQIFSSCTSIKHEIVRLWNGHQNYEAAFKLKNRTVIFNLVYTNNV